MLLADIMVEIEHVLHVVGAGDASARPTRSGSALSPASLRLNSFSRNPELVGRLARCLANDPTDRPRVLVTGDFFTRFSPFFMEGVRDIYDDSGIIFKPVDLKACRFTPLTTWSNRGGTGGD